MCSGKTSPPLYCSLGARCVSYPQIRDNSSNTVGLRPYIDAGGDLHEKHLELSYHTVGNKQNVEPS